MARMFFPVVSAPRNIDKLHSAYTGNILEMFPHLFVDSPFMLAQMQLLITHVEGLGFKVTRETNLSNPRARLSQSYWMQCLLIGVVHQLTKDAPKKALARKYWQQVIHLTFQSCSVGIEDSVGTEIFDPA